MFWFHAQKIILHLLRIIIITKFRKISFWSDYQQSKLLLQIFVFFNIDYVVAFIFISVIFQYIERRHWSIWKNQNCMSRQRRGRTRRRSKNTFKPLIFFFESRRRAVSREIVKKRIKIASFRLVGCLEMFYSCSSPLPSTVCVKVLILHSFIVESSTQWLRNT